jgi:hypothetical protein
MDFSHTFVATSFLHSQSCVAYSSSPHLGHAGVRLRFHLNKLGLDYRTCSASTTTTKISREGTAILLMPVVIDDDDAFEVGFKL